MATQGAHNPLLRVRVPPSQPVMQVWYIGCASAFQADELSSSLSTCSKFYCVDSVTDARLNVNQEVGVQLSTTPQLMFR